MKIKQIELAGFKSFADKTLLALHNGITCIVGPNGCGKSNVVDAFRWVLGEQSAKSLRGEKMEEVIFQGSANKKQKGMAEVTLTISQSGQTVPKNGTEDGNGSSETFSDQIIVSRRLYRSGESEYLLNKRQCRLKDIKDIFLDTGLDVKSYSILDQGRISEIINTKPVDRRFLIEEVAGVMKYKVRKAEALSKLESSKQNLQRINDIVYEVKRQINSLDRQVKKAERYKRLIEEVKTIELRIAKREHTSLSTILNSLLAETERLRELDSSKRGELSTLENLIETKRLELAEMEKAFSEVDTALQGKERDIADSERQRAVLKANRENTKTDIARLTNQQNEIDNKKTELTAKIAELEETGRSLLSNTEGLSEELREKKDSVADIEAAIGEKEDEIENRRKDLFRVSEHLGNKKNELHKHQSSLETLAFRETTATLDTETIKTGIEALTNAVSEAEEFIKVKNDELAGARTDRESLTAETSRLKDTIENKKTLLSQERELLASTTARLNSLKELIIDKSLKDFMQDLQNTEGRSYAVLSDIINADSNYEIAIEAVLSDRINSLTIDKIEDIHAALKIIKEKNLGKTSLLYTGFNSENTSSTLENVSHSNIIGKASDFISFENAEAQKIARTLLDSTYIVKDFGTAVGVLNSMPRTDTTRRITLVTLDGEVINSDGWIFAGHGQEILKRKREIKELQKTAAEQHLRIQSLENELNRLADEHNNKKEALRTLESTVIDIEKALSLSQHSMQNQKDELQRKTRKLSFLETEIATIAQEKGSLEAVIQSKTEEINILEQEKDAGSIMITEIQESLSATKAAYEEARAHLTDMKLAIASYREKADAVRNEIGGIKNAISEFEHKKELAIKEVREAEEKISKSVSELQMLDDHIKSVIIEADKMRREKASLKETISAENQVLLSKDAALRQMRSEIDALSQQLSDANAKAFENRLIKENIENAISQKYGLAIAGETVETEGFDPSEDEKNVTALNGKIRDLGPVNLGTIEEYEELKNRYDFLTKQQEDLTMSIAELEEAISRINASTRRKLREAYDTLRTKFSEVFNVLFGGGKADILLTDEENILESGLEIIVQPPGKKLQNLNLLSGGEKALTSLALLFAGFLIKPSPLCILDEADAPLDESNTVRFAQMIKELSNETQFIVISHNRTTMEVADYLYGITMEEPGASKSISLQFAET